MKISAFIPYLVILTLLCGLRTLSAETSSQISANNEKTADSLVSIEKYSDALRVYEKLLNTKEKNPDPYFRLQIHTKIGNCLNRLGREQEAIAYFSKVIMDENARSFQILESDAYNGLGISYEYTGKYDSALTSYIKGYTRILSSGDTMRIARGIRNIAQLLRVMKRYKQAEKYCREALKMIPGISDYKIVTNIFNETAYLFELNGELDSAKYYYTKLIAISVENNYKRGESVGLTNLASVFEREQNYSYAIELKMRAMDIDEELKDTFGIMTSFINLKETYFRMEKYAKALEMLQNASEICDTSWIVNASGIHYGYYEIYKALGNYRAALLEYEIYDSLRNRIMNRETQEKISEIMTRYETDQKEHTIQILEQSNQIRINKIRIQWLLIAGLILLFIAVLIAVRLVITAKDRQLLQMANEIRSLQLNLKNETNKDVDPSGNINPDELYQDLGLTARESDILYYLGQGCTNSEIANKLFVSENTIKFHIKNIYIKLDVKNRVQALIRCNEINHAS